MAFVRDKNKNKPKKRKWSREVPSPAYQLVESIRVDGRPRQKVLVHLGRFPTVDKALEAWPKEVEWHRRFAADYRHDAELIRRGEAWITGRKRKKYVTSKPRKSASEGDRATSEYWQYWQRGLSVKSAEEGDLWADEYEKWAEVLERKLHRLLDLRERGVA